MCRSKISLKGLCGKRLKIKKIQHKLSKIIKKKKINMKLHCLSLYFTLLVLLISLIFPHNFKSTFSMVYVNIK